MVRSSLEMPYTTLFRQLKTHEEELSNAYAIEHDIAETLQNAMMVRPHRIAEVDVCLHYRPAPGIGRIGGDFYDVFPLGGSRVGVVIGDVCGKGLKAAGTTLKVRTALRTVALEHPGPAEVLERVNKYLCSELEEDSFVTAAYGTLDTATGLFSVAVAGHPDPLICGRDERPFDACRTQPLGVLSALEANSADVQLYPGESLVFVTDGLVDAPGIAGRFGVGRLASLVGRLHCAHSADEVCEQVVTALGEHTDEQIDDDVAIVVVRWSPQSDSAQEAS